MLYQRLDLRAGGHLTGRQLHHRGFDGRRHQLLTDQVLNVGHIGVDPCGLLRQHLIGHDHVRRIHRGLIGGFAPDLRLDALILLLVVHLVDALHEGDGEVHRAALDGFLLDLAEAGLHAGIAGGNDVNRENAQDQQNDEGGDDQNALFHSRFPPKM